jgi:hypothetical protein
VLRGSRLSFPTNNEKQKQRGDENMQARDERSFMVAAVPWVVEGDRPGAIP